MNLITEINKTIQLLENQIPANPASTRNERLEKQLTKSLNEYFKGLDQAIDWNGLEQIYYRNVKQD